MTWDIVFVVAYAIPIAIQSKIKPTVEFRNLGVANSPLTWKSNSLLVSATGNVESAECEWKSLWAIIRGFLFCLAISSNASIASENLPWDTNHLGDSSIFRKSMRTTAMMRVSPPMRRYWYRHPIFSLLRHVSCVASSAQEKCVISGQAAVRLECEGLFVEAKRT